MWAESIWIQTRDAWREVRATEPGLLDGLPGERDEPGDDRYHHKGGFSLVTYPDGGRVKKLPSLYVNNQQIYGDRDVAVVRAKLDRTVEAFSSADVKSTFMLTACEIEGRRGLFGTDFFNRSAYRSKMKRLGMRFSDDPFVVFDGETTFESADFEPFTPSFLTLPLRSSKPPGVIEVRGAFLVHQLTYYRIADISAEELSALVKLTARLDARTATEPADLVAELTGAAAGA